MRAAAIFSASMGMVFVVNRPWMSDSARRVTAGPESTACEKHAWMEVAPWLFRVLTVPTSGPAVATMSSTTILGRPCRAFGDHGELAAEALRVGAGALDASGVGGDDHGVSEVHRPDVLDEDR